MKVRAYLVLIALVVLGPTIMFSGVALHTVLQDKRDAALQSVREAADATAAGVDRELNGAMTANRVLATSHHLATGNLPGFYKQALAANTSPDTWTVLFNRAGQQLINTHAPYGAELPQRRHPQHGEEILQSQKPSVSNLVTGLLVDRYIVAIDSPVILSNGAQYVIAQAFLAEHFDRAFPRRELPAGSTISILDRQGVTIARSTNPVEAVGRLAVADVISAARTAEQGVLRHRTAGVAVYDVYTHSAASGWTIVVNVPANAIDAPAWRSVGVLLAGLLAAIVCGIALAALLGRRLTRPIMRAVAATRALGHGVVSEQAGSKIVEFNTLHQAVRETGLRLAGERAAHKQAEAERKQLYTAEQQARKTAESHNRAKDEFIAMLGHELRNPLNAITAANALLDTQELSPESSARARSVIARQSQHLGRIVDDLMDLSRVISGRVLLNRGRIDLAEVVRDCVARLATARHIEEHATQVNTEPAWIDADPKRIEQICNNLLLNAAKYTPAGGRIEVAVHSAGNEAVLTVRDSGVGISAQLLPNVFDTFVRGPARADGAQGGLGIGLALVRRLVRLHGGSVLASSDGDGQGSTFTVRLPLAPPLPGESTSDQPVPGARTKCKVLLIEDNEDGRRTLATILGIHGYQVLEAGDGPRGIELALLNRPEVAVVDLGLPGMDGYEIARRLLDAPETRSMRLIALTGFSRPEDRRRAVEAGFDMYLVKPIEPARLVDAISTMNHVRL